MKQPILLFALLCATTFTQAQIGIGTASPNAASQLEVSSTSKGFLPPRMTAAQRNAISTPVAGLMVWCSNCGSNGEIQIYNGTEWVNFIGGTRQMTAASTKLGSDIDGEAQGDRSGYSVSISSDGTKVAIGALDNNGGGSDAGQVRVYQYSNNAWAQIGLDIDGEAAGNQSGMSVALSGDGTTVAIGAPGNSGINGAYSGHVRVYRNNSGTWTKIGSDIDGEAANDGSGRSVAISSDGNIVAIGTPNNGTSNSRRGQVRVYQYSSSTWTQIGADIDGGSLYEESGEAVAISSDGTIVAIGAPQNSNGNGNGAGQVRVYKNIAGTWTKLGADIDGEAESDVSGSSVAISSDGTIVAIGAKWNDGGGNSAGQVRVYQYINSSWTKIGSDIDGSAANDQAGTSVAISSDGTIVAIGATQSNFMGPAYAGYVKLYKNVSGTWTLIGQKIDGEASSDASGSSVSISSNGTIVGIGAPANSGVNGSGSGQVRVYYHTGAL
jgi:Flp pilus assembly pilin Flp